MAAAKRPAAASGASSLRPVDIQGTTVNVDDSKLSTWKAFELIGVISDETTSAFAKSGAIFELIEYATDTTKQEILEGLGGDEADPTEVIRYALELITAIAPKN